MTRTLKVQTFMIALLVWLLIMALLLQHSMKGESLIWFVILGLAAVVISLFPPSHGNNKVGSIREATLRIPMLTALSTWIVSAILILSNVGDPDYITGGATAGVILGFIVTLVFSWESADGEEEVTQEVKPESSFSHPN